MEEKATSEFVDFMTRIMTSVFSTLKKNYAGVSFGETFCPLPSGCIERALSFLVQDWKNHSWKSGTADDFESMVSVLLIDLLGILNEVSLPEGIDRPKFRYYFLSLVSKAMYNDVIRARFISLSSELLLNKAA